MKVVRKERRRHMIVKEEEEEEYKTRGGVLVVDMAWVVDYSRLFWLLFGVFSYENHEGKPRILF
ncbi:unnamed protein product [Eruca vesicaria subsp. sativa]|uniref:Transmembrane protein n=1 Tax=Eruca vesicaria subsp. sativa TaxID=29727 RepID=A0ABC8KMX6_ERUVS|nr:unnamed protein product [Eruca vesicaria subsp. sativa]